MSSVKTYHKVSRENKEASFKIARTEDIYQERKGKTDEPHRHDFYTVIVVKQAEGVHKIDFNAYHFNSHQLFFVAPGQVHQVIEKNKPQGFAMTFSTQFLIQNSIQLAFIESLNLFSSYGESPPLEPEKEQFELIEKYCNEILKFYQGNANMKDLSIGAYLKLLLIECNNICSINPIENTTDLSGSNVIRTFRQLVNTAYKKEHSTSFYAHQLNITADHLNRIVKSKIGKTAKEYIQSRIITEAKRLLHFSDLSNKEIGFELGFNEPANFSAFFKKCTQLSPSHFKKRETQL